MEMKRKRDTEIQDTNIPKIHKTIPNAPTIKPRNTPMSVDIEITDNFAKVPKQPKPSKPKIKKPVSTDPVWELKSTTDGDDVITGNMPKQPEKTKAPIFVNSNKPEKVAVPALGNPGGLQKTTNTTPKAVSFNPTTPLNVNENDNNSEMITKIVDAFSHKPDKSRSDLTPLRAMEDLSEKQPFNMSRFLDSIPLNGLSFLDLMQLSASARRKLTECLKIVPKTEYRNLLANCPTIQQLKLDEDNNYQDIVENNPDQEPNRILNMYMAKFTGGVTTPRSSTHLLQCKLNNIPISSHVDSGCCLIAIKDEWIKNKQIHKTLEHSRFGLRAAQGEPALVTGEVHNMVCEFANIRVVFGAVVVRGLDCDVLLGRPFLELTRAITMWDSSIYHYIFDASWAMIQGITGVALTSRKLTPLEDAGWTNGVVPKHNIRVDIPSKTIAGNSAAKTSALNHVVEIDEANEPGSDEDSENNADDDLENEDLVTMHAHFFQMYPNIEFVSQQDMELEMRKEGTKIHALSMNYAADLQQISHSMHHDYQRKADEVQEFFMDIQKLRLETGTTSPLTKDELKTSMLKLKKIEIPYLEDVDSTSKKVDVNCLQIKIATYNVNSIRNTIKKRAEELPKLFKHNKVVCLQEARLIDEQIDKLDLTFGKDYCSYWSTCETIKGYSSVVTFIHRSLRVKKDSIFHIFPGYDESTMEGRYLDVEIENNIVIINCYFPNGRMPSRKKYKDDFSNAFLQRYNYLKEKNKIIIFACDLNVSHHENDIDFVARNNIESQSGFQQYERKWIDDLLETGLIDSWRFVNPTVINQYTTWLSWKNARLNNHGMRFDYLFISNDSSVEITYSRILYDYFGSDHVPVEASFNIWYVEEDPKKIYSLYSPDSVGDPNTDDKFTIDGMCEDEFLKSLNIVQEDGKYYKKIGSGDNEVKIFIRPRRDAKPTPTEDFVVDGFTFQIAADAPEHGRNLMREALSNRKCFVNKGEPGRTLTNVPEVKLDFNPPEDYKFPYIGSKSWKIDEREFFIPWTEKMVKHSKIGLAPPPIKTVAVPVLSTSADGKKKKATFNFRINEHLLPMVYPIAPSRDVLAFIALAMLLSGFDFSSAYEQNPLARDSRWLTNILLPTGIYQFWVSPIGLKVSGEWFSYNVENNVLKSDEQFKEPEELPLEKYVKLYRDDLTQTQDEPEDYELHANVTSRVMTVMDYHTGSFSAHKVFLLVRCWVILGYLVGNGELIPTEDKVNAIMKWPFPQTQTALQSFVGFIIFLNHCIHSPQHSIHVLSRLQKHCYKNGQLYKKEIEENKKMYYKAFYTLKRLMAYRFSLSACDAKRPAILIGDSSIVSAGGIAAHALNKLDDSNINAATLYTPFHLQSRKFTAVELLKMSMPELELGGVVHLAKKVKPFIGEEIYIMMDHQAWVKIRNRDNAQTIRAKNMLAYLDNLSSLTGYPKYIFRKGKKHTDVDVLSRLPTPGPDLDNIDIDEVIHESIETGVEVNVSMKLLQIGWDYDYIAAFLQGRSLDIDNNKYKQIVRKANDYFIRGDKLYRKTVTGVHSERLVPKYGDIHKIITDSHVAHGHSNPIITIAMLVPRYYWDTLVRDVNLHYNGCQVCQQRRRYASKKYKLYRILPPRSTMIWIGIDVLSLPMSSGINGLFNVIDYGTSWGNCYPVRNAVKNSATSRTFIKHLENWMSIFGAPIRLFIDNASTFISDEFKNWGGSNNIIIETPSSGHSMGNAKIERFNYTITLILAKLLIDNGEPPSRWMTYLARAIKIYRIRIKRVQGMSPYQALFKQDYEPFEEITDNGFLYTYEEMEQLAITHHDYILQLNEHFDKYRHNRHNDTLLENDTKIEPVPYAAGDIVWLYNKQVDTNISTQRKLDLIWLGPYQIRESCGNGAYILYDLVKNVLLKGTRNHLHLWKWTPPTNFLSYSIHRRNLFKLSAHMPVYDTKPYHNLPLPITDSVIKNLEESCGAFDKYFTIELPENEDFQIYSQMSKIDFNTFNNIFINVPPRCISTVVNYFTKKITNTSQQVTIITPSFILDNDPLLTELLLQICTNPPTLIMHDEHCFPKHLAPLWNETLAWTFCLDVVNGGSFAHYGDAPTCTFD